jgi:hypothetical protein
LTVTSVVPPLHKIVPAVAEAVNAVPVTSQAQEVVLNVAVS